MQETQELGFDSWVRKVSWRRKWQPTSVFLPGKSHGQRSLEGYSSWVVKSRTQLSTWAICYLYGIRWVFFYIILMKRPTSFILENTSIICSWGLKRGSAIQVGLKQVSKDRLMMLWMQRSRREERRGEGGSMEAEDPQGLWRTGYLKFSVSYQQFHHYQRSSNSTAHTNALCVESGVGQSYPLRMAWTRN